MQATFEARIDALRTQALRLRWVLRRRSERCLAPSASLDGRSRRRWFKAVEGALTAVLHTVPASPSYRVTKLAGFTPVVAMERAEELRKRFHNHFLGRLGTRCGK